MNEIKHSSHPDAVGQSGTGPSVLLVEDDKAIAMLVSFILEREGYRITHAADGREAQGLIATMAPPELVILDVMLPYLDGFELIAHIRAQGDWTGVPVLMLTSRAGEQDVARALDAGADDYLAKPFQPDELKARLRRLLRRTG